MRRFGRRGSSRPNATRSWPVAAAALVLACSAALTAGALLGGAEQTPQSSPTETRRPQFRSGVLLVEVDVTAIDEYGRPVIDLRQDELEVYEDGHPREIVSFARVDIPIPPPRPLAHRDVATNAGADRSRIVFLVLDDANSRERASSGVREAAKELLARLAPEDRVGMLFVSTVGEGAFEFTTDHAGLAAAVDAFAGEIVNPRSRSDPNTVDLSPRLGPGEIAGDFRDLPKDENLKTEFDRLRPFGIVADVSAYLASLPHRRKALVYIGESLEPLGPESPGGGDEWDERQRTALRRAVTTARRANVAVYLLDPRRPLREGAEDLFDADRPRDLARLRAGNLSTLAEVTGGFSALNRALVSQIDRIVTDASAYYLLGYRTDPEPAPGLAGRLHRMASAWADFRHIEVRTSRPGVRLRARRGYWPGAEAEREAESTRPTSPRTDAASEALRGLVPRPALALASFAAPFRGRDGKPVIAIAVEVQDAAFAAAAASGLDETLTVSLVAAEPGEKVRAADRFTARMRLGSEKAVALAGGRYLVCATLPVNARRYQLRIGVQSAVAGTAGSVYQDVVVPDFRRRALSMSGVVLGLGTTQSPMPLARAQTLASLMPFLPTLARAFTPTDHVRTYVRVYRPARPTTATLRIAVRPIGGDEPIWTATPPVTFTKDDDAGIVTDLPVASWRPGHYCLSVTLENQQGAVVEQRLLDFEVTH